MSKRIGVGPGYALAFGFKWQALDPLDPNGYARKQMMEQGMLWEATFKVDDTSYLGTSKDDFTELKGIKTLAGAGQMAMHPDLQGKTVLVIMEEPGGDAHPGEVAIVGLLNGNIIIDEYTQCEAFMGILDEFDRRCAKAGKSFTLVGRTITLSPVSAIYSWSDFLPVDSAGILGKAGKIFRVGMVRVKPLEPTLSKKAVAVIGVGIFVFSSIWAYTDYKETARSKALKIEADKKKDAPHLYEAAVSDYLSNDVVPANTIFKQLRNKLANFPTIMAGWTLKQIECGSNGKCVATWDNAASMANFDDFVKRANSEWGEINLSNDGVKISHEIPVDIKKIKLPPRDQWHEERAFLLGVYSNWQKYWIVGFRPEIAPSPTLMAVPIGISPDGLGELPYAVWALKWSIESTPWYLSDGFDNDPGQGASTIPDSITVEKVTISLDRNQQVIFKAQGLVYVRK